MVIDFKTSKEALAAMSVKPGSRVEPERQKPKARNRNSPERSTANPVEPRREHGELVVTGFYEPSGYPLFQHASSNVRVSTAGDRFENFGLEPQVVNCWHGSG